jgi:hypothetical protein
VDSLAAVYLQERLAGLSPEENRALAELVGREVSTIASWRAGRSMPLRRLWPRISEFFGDPRDTMFRAALGRPLAEREPSRGVPVPTRSSRFSGDVVSRAEFEQLSQRLARLETIESRVAHASSPTSN